MKKSNYDKLLNIFEKRVKKNSSQKEQGILPTEILLNTFFELFLYFVCFFLISALFVSAAFIKVVLEPSQYNLVILAGVVISFILIAQFLPPFKYYHPIYLLRLYRKIKSLRTGNLGNDIFSLEELILIINKPIMKYASKEALAREYYDLHKYEIQKNKRTSSKEAHFIIFYFLLNKKLNFSGSNKELIYLFGSILNINPINLLKTYMPIINNIEKLIDNSAGMGKKISEIQKYLQSTEELLQEYVSDIQGIKNKRYLP